MTRAQVNQQLRHMEHIRHLGMEAESVRQKRALDREYAAIWKSIEPWVTGKKPYSEAA